MARSDLLLKLIQHGAAGDNDAFRRAAEAVIADERAKKHNVLADRLESYLRQSKTRSYNGNGNGNGNGRLDSPAGQKARDLVREIWPERRLEDLHLPSHVRTEINELLREHQRADMLRSYGLDPRNRVLLIGPPGNGKTTLAEAVADALALPLFVVQYHAIVGSFLGETSSRLAKLFDFVRAEPGVVFFDEFETIAKERGDEHEVGEIKRVVSSLLMEIDSLPSRTIVIVASNHPELLDRAVWRRFQLRVELPRPSRGAIQAWLDAFAKRNNFKWPRSTQSLARYLYGLSFAEVEDFANDVYRKYVLALPDAKPAEIVRARLKQLENRARPASAESDHDTDHGTG